MKDEKITFHNSKEITKELEVCGPYAPKTLREVRDFLNTIDEQFLDKDFILIHEHELHRIDFLEASEEDLYHDPEFLDWGSMLLSDWEELFPETDIHRLEISIKKGEPLIGENF